MARILVLNGCNLNFQGIREKHLYGTTPLSAIEQSLLDRGNELGVKVECFQSNHEGELIDKIQAANNQVDFILFNPGGFTHYSYALRDAVKSVDIPTLEIHITNIHARATQEPFRHISVIAPVCIGQIAGLGPHSYLLGLEGAVQYLNGHQG